MSGKPKQQKTEEVRTTQTQAQNTQQGQTSSTRMPWEPAADYFTDIYNTAAKAVKGTNNKPFQGDFIAPPTQGQRDSVQMLYDVAGSGLDAGAIPLRDMALRIAGGEFLDPNNAILRGGIEGTINPIKTQLMNEVIPGITDAAMKGGAYGGTANTLLQTKAVDDYARASQDLSGKMTLDWLNNRFGDVFRTPEMFAASNTLALAPGTVTGLAGEQERGLDQLEADNAVKQYENKMMAPWYGLDQFMNLLTAGGFGTQTGTTTQSGTSTGTSTGQATSTATGAEPDMATQILQGLTGGAGVLAGLGQAFPQTMSAIGGGSMMAPIMQGLALLSDRRLKEDIKQVGRLDNGLPIYKYRYKGGKRFHIGLMADEVESVNPAAVESLNGIKFVNYDLATEQ